MNETTSSEAVKTGRMLLSKVPEVTVWFWVIKILCTTVGESFADWINMTLGVGLTRPPSSSRSSLPRFWGGS